MNKEQEKLDEIWKRLRENKTNNFVYAALGLQRQLKISNELTLALLVDSLVPEFDAMKKILTKNAQMSTIPSSFSFKEVL